VSPQRLDDPALLAALPMTTKPQFRDAGAALLSERYAQSRLKKDRPVGGPLPLFALGGGPTTGGAREKDAQAPWSNGRSGRPCRS
jgi:hypothetical protein